MNAFHATLRRAHFIIFITAICASLPGSAPKPAIPEKSTPVLFSDFYTAIKKLRYFAPKSRTKPRGIYNATGAQCYFSSALQFLLGIPDLRAQLLADFSGNAFSEFAHIYFEDNRDIPIDGAVSGKVFSALPKTKGVSIRQQDDASIPLAQILGELITKDSIRETYFLDYHIVKKQRCKHCTLDDKITTVADIPFIVFPPPFNGQQIDEKACDIVHNLYKKFFSEATIGNNDTFTGKSESCGKGEHRCTIYQTLKLLSEPNNFIMYIPNFSPNATIEMTKQKNSPQAGPIIQIKHIYFPLEFALDYTWYKLPQEDTAIYTLTCFILRNGQSTTSGHYYAYVKYENQWYQANDSIITQANNVDQISKNGNDGVAVPMVFCYSKTDRRQIAPNPHLLELASNLAVLCQAARQK